MTALAERNLDVFTPADVGPLYAGSRAALDAVLQRLQRDGWIVRLRHGLYASKPSFASLRHPYAPPEMVAVRAVLAPGEYVSFQTALDIHGLVDQPASTVYVRARTRRRASRSPGFRVRFVYSRDWQGPVRTMDVERVPVATVEQAVVDAVRNLRLIGGIQVVAQALWRGRRDLSWDALNDIVGTNVHPSVVQRLGFLAEHLGLAHPYIGKWSELVRHGSPVPLDLGSDLKTGEHDARWHIYRNVSGLDSWRLS